MTLSVVEKERSIKWTETRFGEIIEYVTSGSRDWSKFYADSGAIFIRTQDINTNRLRLDDVARVKLPDKVEGKRTRIFKGDILITITGANVGKVALVENEIEEAYVSQSVALVRLKEPSFGRFLHYQLMTKSSGDKTHLEAKAYGLGRPVLNLDNLREVPIRLVQLEEQKRIVAEIEKQFSRLDEAVADLKRVMANLKRYKAAVLKAAVEGRLIETEAEIARHEGRTYETGAQLLQRIHETHRSQWNGKSKYKEPAVRDMTDLPNLPEGWVWASAEQVCGSVRDGTHDTPAYVPEGVPLITSKNLTEQGIDYSNVKHISVSDHNEISRRSGVDLGDVLFAMIGTIGNPCEVKTENPFSIKNVGLFKQNSAFLLSSYLCYWLSSLPFRKWLGPRLKGTTQKFAPLGLLRKLPVPLPSFNEQRRIVAEADRRLSLVRDVETQIDADLVRAVRMKQALLADFFSGKGMHRVNEDCA